jgi:hypothetical protein
MTSSLNSYLLVVDTVFVRAMEIRDLRHHVDLQYLSEFLSSFIETGCTCSTKGNMKGRCNVASIMVSAYTIGIGVIVVHADDDTFTSPAAGGVVNHHQRGSASALALNRFPPPMTMTRSRFAHNPQRLSKPKTEQDNARPRRRPNWTTS